MVQDELQTSGPNVVDGLTDHIYNLGPGVDPTLINKIQDPLFLDQVAETYKDISTTVRLFGPWSGAWVGEFGGTYTTVAPTMSPTPLLMDSVHTDSSSICKPSAPFQSSQVFDNKEDSSTSTTDRKLQPQITQSFKERKRSQSWLRRQFSRQTSSDYELSGADYQAAVAAAAYAIQSLDDLKSKDNKEAANKSLSKMKDKSEATITRPEPLKSALKSADETLRSSFKNPNQTNTNTKKTPEKEPSFKKRISFADNEETIIRNKPENSAPDERVPEVGPTFRADSKKKPETIMPKTNPVDSIKPTAVKSGPGDYRADDWEIKEIENIRERYVKLRATIDNWETKKKKKAKRKIERAEIVLGLVDVLPDALGPVQLAVLGAGFEEVCSGAGDFILVEFLRLVAELGLGRVGDDLGAGEEVGVGGGLVVRVVGLIGSGLGLFAAFDHA
ncbi:Heparanase-like protein 1 [Striga hermonthica]|uniref:Heparanase-like protein 1 n=1 Tax=Striga hermonthica TaxID=68872 RepID=A0A9N7NC34_STRHE|nr:Heparanase-like protein 1 [Striga hermonthica]